MSTRDPIRWNVASWAGMSIRGAWSWLLVAGVLVLLQPTGVRASPATPFERMGLADVVVWARTTEGSLRLAECEVLEVLKGSFKGEKVFIAFRAENMTREHWKDRILFEDGKESILFLRAAEEPPEGSGDREPFHLVGGILGKIDLPREGAEAHVQAFRHLGRILELPDIHQVWNAYRDLLHEHNPYLIETGFSQVQKFRLGNPTMVPGLLEYLDSRHESFRDGSLKVLRQVLQDAHRRHEPLGNEDHVLARVLTTALEDPAPHVRARAVEVLTTFPHADVTASLDSISRSDPSQDVRYAATLALYRMRYPGTKGELGRGREKSSSP